MIRAVLSDWGHTLFDTAGSVEFIVRWAADQGRPVDPGDAGLLYRAAFARSRTPEELAKGRDLDPQRHRACWMDIWRDLERAVPGISAPLYAYETGPLGWSPFVDTRDFLEALAARRVPVVVVSDVAFDLRPIFDHYGLRHLVHEFVISGEHGSVKADGELFRLALEAAGVESSAAVMVGDNPANDGYAVLHGIRTVLLPLVPSGQPRGLAEVLRLIA